MISWQSIIYKPLQGRKLCQGSITENILNNLKRLIPQLLNAIFWFAWQLLNKKSIRLWGIWASLVKLVCVPRKCSVTTATAHSGGRGGRRANTSVWGGSSHIVSVYVCSSLECLSSDFKLHHWWLNFVWICFLGFFNIKVITVITR